MVGHMDEVLVLERSPALQKVVQIGGNFLDSEACEGGEHECVGFCSIQNRGSAMLPARGFSVVIIRGRYVWCSAEDLVKARGGRDFTG
jgi:hypothetical protein